MNLNKNIKFCLDIIKSQFKITNPDTIVNLIIFHNAHCSPETKLQKTKNLTLMASFVIKYITNLYPTKSKA